MPKYVMKLEGQVIDGGEFKNLEEATEMLTAPERFVIEEEDE